MNTLKNSTRHKPKATIVLNTKETRITPKQSIDMVSPPWKLLFEALFLTKFSLKMWKRGFGSLGAHQRAKMGVRIERWGWVLIGKVHHQFFVRPANVRKP
jgi:hypothetical protein